MLLNSYFWKDELCELIDEIKIYSSLSEDEDKDAPDVSYSEFRLERALIYSAFVIRLLYDAEKLTDLMKDYRLSVIKVRNTLANANEIYPIFRKWPDPEYYDFGNKKITSINARYLINQIIHSFVVISFKTDDQGTAISFYATSDYDANKVLYCIDIKDWIAYIKAVIGDDIKRIDSHYNEDAGKWITVRM